MQRKLALQFSLPAGTHRVEQSGPTTGFFDHSWLKLNFNLVR